MTRVQFMVSGIPAPQGSKRPMQNRHTGRLFTQDMGGQRLKDWRQDVKSAAHVYMLESFDGVGRKPLTGPLAVSLKFMLKKPQSKPQGWREWPSHWLNWPWRQPDIDKLVRSTFDGLTGSVWVDDAQVVALMTSKNYPRNGLGTGVDVLVWQIGEGDFVDVLVWQIGEGDFGD